MKQNQNQQENEGKIVFSLYVIFFIVLIPTMIYFYSTYGNVTK